MAQRNEAVPYETKGMEGGMDMFEKQFDGVIKVKLLASTPLVQSISFKSTKFPNFFVGKTPLKVHLLCQTRVCSTIALNVYHGVKISLRS